MRTPRAQWYVAIDEMPWRVVGRHGQLGRGNWSSSCEFRREGGRGEPQKHDRWTMFLVVGPWWGVVGLWWGCGGASKNRTYDLVIISDAL